MTDVLPVTVVIPTRGRPEQVRAAVESVLAGSALPQELIVVDQSEHPHQWLEALDGGTCQIRYLWPQEPGVSRARNLGAREARHELLAFVDDDVTVDTDWLTTMVATLREATEPVVVTGQVAPGGAGEGIVPSTKTDPRPASYRGRIRADVLFSNNMGLPRSLAEKLGLFDERLGPGTRFLGAEDNDFAFRLLDAGYSILYEPRAIVYHADWRDVRALHRVRWAYGVGQGAFYAKHLHVRDPFVLSRMLGDVARRLARVPALAVRDRRRAVGEVIYLAGVFAGTTRWLLTVRAAWARSPR
jgi:GT2 family glycosyltransferase